jgi:hypothetical protein
MFQSLQKAWSTVSFHGKAGKMDITFGKYQGKSSQEVVVKHGSYVKWVLGQPAAGSALATLQAELKRLIAILDGKPHPGKCSYSGCTHPVVKLTAYENDDSDLYAWCADCDPYSLGANKGKLSIIGSYKDALNHVALRCGATQGAYDRIVRAYAHAKGLPSRVGASSAKKFFA